MRPSISSSLLLSSLVHSAISIPFPSSSHAHTKFNWPETKALIAFGDSYTYVQGPLGHANSTFIGDLQNLAFTPEQLLSNPIVQNLTATAEGGPNWVEYLTGCGLKLGLTYPRNCTLQLWDFAFGGSDISVDFTPLHHNYTVSLSNQVRQFLTSGNPVLETFLDKSRTLVTSWIGINDIGDSANYNVSSFPAFYDTLQTRHFEEMESVYRAGYKQFLFMNLPPLDRRPGLVFARNPRPNRTMVEWWDDALASHVDAFQANHEDAKVMLFDVNAVLNGVLDNATQYGYKNWTGYCASYDQPYIYSDPAQYGCLPQNEYFWFNTGHMTSRTHELLTGFLRRFLESQ